MKWLFFIASASAASVSLDLRSEWQNSPFEVQLLEAVSGSNDTTYLSTALALFSEQGSDSDWDNEEEWEDEKLDFGSYKRATAKLSPIDLDLANFNLKNHVFSPRIKSHYDHFAGIDEEEILKACAKDSFGETLEDPSGAWVKYGSKIYCSEPDLYALQTDSRSEDLYAFDRVVGENDAAPLLALYGDPTCDRFAAMFSTLYQLAAQGNVRFVWRYILRDASPVPMAGYGKTLLLKEKSSAKGVKFPPARSFSKIQEMAKGPIYEFDEEDLPAISLALTALLMEENSLAKLTDAVFNLPRYAPYLARAKPANLYEVKEAAAVNERKGASSELMGISVNGAPVHRLETDMSHVIDKIHAELEHIEAMSVLGFSPSEAKLLFSKFALLSSVKETEFRTGTEHSRFAIYRDSLDFKNPNLGGVVFFNNIEKDPNYSLYSADRYEVYVENASKLKRGQVPPLRENVHDLIFVLNFSNKSQLKVFFAMSKIVLDNGIAQQMGILPLFENAKDEEIARKFYHILEVGEVNEALAFLYKYYESSAELETELLDLVLVSEDFHYPQANRTLQKFNFNEATIVVNGIMHDMRSPTWQSQMVNQIIHDVTKLKALITEGTDRGSLKEILYADAKSERNTRIIPKDPSNIRYKLITTELIENSVSFRKVVNSALPSVNFWIIGDFNSNIILDQLKNILKFMRQYNGRSTQVRIFNTAEDSAVLQSLSEYALTHLSSSKLREMAQKIGDVRIQSIASRNETKISLLEKHQIQTHQPALLFNSRYLRLELVFSVRELEQLLGYEFTQRVGILDEICSAYLSLLQDNSIMDFKDEEYDSLDWFDLVTSRITASFNMEDSLVRADVARFDFSSLDLRNSIQITSGGLLDVLVVIDPVDEFSQTLLALIEAIKDFSFVNLRVLIQPLSQSDVKPALNRLYASQFVSLTPEFSLLGEYLWPDNRNFTNLPDVSVIADLDAPINWHYVKGNGTDQFDLDSLLISENVVASFTLSRLVVETFVRDVRTGQPVAGLTFEAQQGEKTRQGRTLLTLGYNQMQLEPGLWLLRLNSASNERYEVLSVDENRYNANDQALSSMELPLFSLFPSYYNARIRCKSELAPGSRSKKADINIFSISMGQSYEKLMAIMMLSVKKHASKTVKFWLLEDYLSKTMQEQLPLLALEFGFEYELVSYKWPVWLRKQREPNRTVWGFKILFLDVLFPSDLYRVIFVDADQVARTDLQELMEIDLHDAPYGFTPMCESRKEMEGYMFWKTGYWQNVLKQDLKYHISALYVVDLATFRQLDIGEKLRSHYQKLSSDALSLSNLDQDLPNNLQRVVPIFSLPQEWLWCETWCSSELKGSAKMIDMCNDPTSTEGKLEKARRIIVEWDDYNKQLLHVGKGALEIDHDEL